jgi:cyanophycinase
MTIKNFDDWLLESLNMKPEDLLIEYLNYGENFALIGGAESEKTMELVINELGSRNALVITTATAYKEEAKGKYLKIFNSLGCDTDFIDASDNGEVDTDENLMKLEAADTILFVGGDQSRIARCYIGTSFLDIMKEKVSEGMALIGTSAGAMAMSEVMIAGGKENPIIIKGLSILPNIIIDTHFRERDRKSRLKIAVGRTPDKIGLGISEDTAIVFKGKKILILGKSNIEVI